MKKIKKALALVLALAMIATVVPVASTEAASTAKLSATTATIAVGSKKVIKLTTPSTWKKVKTSWKVGKKSVAQIVTVTKKASVRAQAAGETNVKVKVTYAKSNKKGAKRYSKSLNCKVTVKNYLFKSVKQTAKNKLEAVISGDTSKGFKPEDFTVTSKATSVVNPVKSVTVDKNDATKVIIETFADMTDGKDYTVVFDGTTKEFTATDGAVKAVSVDTTTIPYGQETTIKASSRDANGVELASFTMTTDKPNNYDFTIETANGYTSGDKLYLVNKGDTAKAKIVVHSGKYDANGVETENITTEATITAVDPEAVSINNFKVRIGAAGKSYKTVADNTKVAVGETKTAYFEILNSKGEEIGATDYANYTVETSNKDVMLLGSDKLGAKNDVTVTPVSTGTAYIVVKDSKKNVVATVAVSIVASKTATSLVLSKAAATLSNATSVDDNKASIDVTVKDQYGDDWNTKVTPVVKCVSVSKDATAKETAEAKATPSLGKVEFSAVGLLKGTYTYTVSVDVDNKTFTKTVVITVQAPEGNVSYNLALSANTVDAVVDNTSDDNMKDKTITIKVAELKGGVTNSYVTPDKISITKDGKEVSKASSFDVVKFTDGVAAKAATGTYVVTAEYTYTPEGASKATTVKLTRSFTVTDSQKTVSVARVSDTYKAGDDVSTIASEAFTYTYDGTVYTNNAKVRTDNKDAKAVELEGTPEYVLSDGSYFVKKVTVKIPVTKDGKTVYFTVKVDVNKTVSLEK